MEEEMSDYIKAGKIAAQALNYAESLAKPGMKILDLADQVEQKIIELGGQPAFPINISFDDTAAHYTPVPEDLIVLDKQLVKLDVGVHVNGCVGGDTARTVDLSGSYTDLVKASKAALDAAIKVVQIGTTLGEIGKEIEQAIESFGYKPVRNLSGHGIGKWTVHEHPSVPNYDNKDTTELEDGMTIAIEPFASAGAGFIQEKGIANIHSIVGKKPVRNMGTRKVLKIVEPYNGLPFANRWLTKSLPAFKVSFALRELNQLDILHSYPPLVDRANGFISQAEHSLLIGDKVKVLTKKD